jgi:hypothetical protein
MEGNHPAATESLTYPSWPVNSSNKSSSMHREDAYPPSPILPSYPTYDSNSYATGFNHSLPQPPPQTSQDMYQFSWPNAITTTPNHHHHLDNNSSNSPLEDKFNHQQASSDFLLRKKASFVSCSPSLPSNHMSFTSLPMYHYSNNARPNNTAAAVRDASKFHPRFKSANARLSPYSEQQQREVVYHQFLSPPLVSNTLMGQGPLLLEEGLEGTSPELQPFHQNKERVSNQT